MSPGRALSQQLFEQAARPVIERVLSGRGYVAARLGSGSDVLGFDDHRSRDHDFGCRLTVLVEDEDEALLTPLDVALAAELPAEVDGRPTRFASTWDDRVRHRVELHTVHGFAASRLGFELRRPLLPEEWLCLTGQSVLEVTGGPVFHDGTETYGRLTRTLAWYPDDLWRYVLAAGWGRLVQELPLVGRAAEVGDEAGSRVVASRLCRVLAHLTALVERTWLPYPKWTGTALDRLPGGRQVAEATVAVQAASGWQDRQRLLSDAIDGLAERHRRAGFDLPAPAVVPFYDRPFVVPDDAIGTSLRAGIVDPDVRDLPPLGSIEQWCDNVDVLARPERRASAVALYEPRGRPHAP